MPAKGFELKHFLHLWPLHRVAASRRFIKLGFQVGLHLVKEEQESSWQATQESAAGQTRTAAEKGGGYKVG